ncbi:heterokaryon incompatibility protein-domain-containing protein [Paraphoma chrysanthemicola]|uniref:Heterokaryon incompatibility protein-domain-containing protein n=1 Tax=Paraphoma chrysanthemicola TaxID=798071 RepID=A0A8K0VRU3_9PLEO|nr:heterokaryon incompatibility protein-domain-containing protein [Paraphoma chrysanthemicola]
MYSYQKIHKWQTRLVLIEPNADHSAHLELSLVVVDLVDLSTGAVVDHERLVTYDALSYAWGTSLPSIECVCNGTTILLRDNLASALRYLRQPQGERYVWIDFLCINQEDDVEKAVQIPLMRSIYSKASTVVVWLGESLAIQNIVRRCYGECGMDVEILACSTHKEELWQRILDYTWFRRTWVRQEVFAAKKLNICCPYFSTSWELFIDTMLKVETPGPTSSEKAVQNLESLNQLYKSSTRLDLLDLLKQGTGFQASVPHDHVFSVLGMLHIPKHDTNLFLVTYDKTYDEICGDITRFIIRKTGDLSILQLCPLQRNRSYAFNWPAVELVCPLDGEHYPRTQNRGDSSELSEYFDRENPIREVGAPVTSDNTTSSSTSDRPSSIRPLVLYGREWGTLTYLGDDWHWHLNKHVPAYLAEHAMNDDLRTTLPAQKDVEEYCIFRIFKDGFVRRHLGGILQESKRRVGWDCVGSVRNGDIFVSFQPGPYCYVLRKGPEPGDLYEIVGSAGFMMSRSEEGFAPVEDETAHYFDYGRFDHDGIWRIREAQDAPGPRKRFKIR